MIYNIIPAGAGGFKVREEDGRGNHIKTWPGIHATVVEAQAHITDMTTVKPKTAAQAKADEKAAAEAKEAEEKAAADKADAEAALEKETADKEAEEKAAAEKKEADEKAEADAKAAGDKKGKGGK